MCCRLVLNLREARYLQPDQGSTPGLPSLHLGSVGSARRQEIEMESANR
jgi:hypothetical protein